jgi:hypothetical protein
MISEYAIWSYFAQAYSRHWSVVEEGSLSRGWHLRYQGRFGDYDSYLNITEWVYLQCCLHNASISDNADQICREALYKYLLQQNQRMYMAKFTLTEANGIIQVWLITEAPVENFDAGTFRWMTEAIATYAEDSDREIKCLAYKPLFAQKYLSFNTT